MIVLISVISFLLDGIFSNILSDTIFLPLLTIISLVVIFPYFNDNRYRYLKFIALLGLLYDIVYCNTIFYNFFIFMIIGFIVMFIDYLLSNNLYINILSSVACITSYRIINFMLVYQAL